MSLLVIDLGNTRLKWGWHDSNGLHVGEPLVHKNADLDAWLTKNWSFPAAPERVLMTSVAGETLAGQLITFIQRQWHVIPERIYSTAQLGTLKNAYTKPEQLGSDRWVAMFEAYNSVKKNVCVIDCGTAVTIDAIDKSGQHLGGMIMPGFDAMLATLTASTQLSTANIEIPTEFAMATDTQAAIVTGVSQSIGNLAARTLDWLQQRTGEPAACFVTGGDGARLSALLEHEHIVEADLVLKGLARIASET